MQFDSRISDALTFVQKLQADTSADFIRCPYLAKIEIERRKLLFGKNNNDELMETVVHYYLRYLTTPIFCLSICIYIFIYICLQVILEFALYTNK